MTTTLERDLHKVRELAQHNESVAAAVSFLADDHAADDDPFARPPEPLLGAARHVNELRHAQHDSELRARSLTTAEVVELVDGLSGRAAVDRRRKRGRLLGVSHGRTTLHPAWQFSPVRHATREGLEAVLDALHEHTHDPATVDAIATAPQPDAGDTSIAELLATGRVELAVRLARMAGDQS